MNVELQAARMRRSAEAIESLVRDISDEQARWKASPDSWSILEVVNHLYDGDREDFRPRLDIMLHRPDESMKKIDPVRWATERGYNQRDLNDSIAKFRSERRESIRWLGTLKSPNWDAVYQMPSGSLTAGDMFASWVFHDLLHARQLIRLHLAYVKIEMSPFDVGYAGPL